MKAGMDCRFPESLKHFPVRSTPMWDQVRSRFRLGPGEYGRRRGTVPVQTSFSPAPHNVELHASRASGVTLLTKDRGEPCSVRWYQLGFAQNCDIKFRFSPPGRRMRRGSSGSHFYAVCASPGKTAAWKSVILLAAFVLIGSGVPLRAQSDSGLLSALSGSNAPFDMGNGSDQLALGFAPRIQEETRPSASDAAEQSADGDKSADSSRESSPLVAPQHNRPDRNLDIYYRNRREFSLDVGWHPVNIPFIYDFAVGGGYNMTPLKYTLVPIVASMRWHVTNVGWRWIFRGNMDFTFSGSLTAIPRGPETHYYSFDFGIRRNFVYRNWKAVPFFEQRGGFGLINAKEPLGVEFSQGQNLTFTYNLGAGIRYNIDSKYSFSGGMNYMHISNGYLSQPAFYNYGINVYGPMFGLDVRLGRPHHSASE